jgi:hypothetical protein
MFVTTGRRAGHYTDFVPPPLRTDIVLPPRATRTTVIVLSAWRRQVILPIMAHPGGTFPLIERYLGMRLGVDLSKLRRGELRVVETTLRLRPEAGYGYIRAAWWLVWWTWPSRAMPRGCGSMTRATAAG